MFQVSPLTKDLVQVALNTIDQYADEDVERVKDVEDFFSNESIKIFCEVLVRATLAYVEAQQKAE